MEKYYESSAWVTDNGTRGQFESTSMIGYDIMWSDDTCKINWRIH